MNDAFENEMNGKDGNSKEKNASKLSGEEGQKECDKSEKKRKNGNKRERAMG